MFDPIFLDCKATMAKYVKQEMDRHRYRSYLVKTEKQSSRQEEAEQRALNPMEESVRHQVLRFRQSHPSFAMMGAAASIILPPHPPLSEVTCALEPQSLPRSLRDSDENPANKTK